MMMELEKKPILTSAKLVESLENRGVTFDKVSKEEAEKYFLVKNNYFRTACYRKNFEKNKMGENKGKYIDLDFSQLVEISVLDMRYRYLIVHMCLDIEHALKVSLVSYFEENNVNTYTYVSRFLEEYEYIKANIVRMRNKSYCNNIIEKYFIFDDENNLIDWSNCPGWVMVEILAFGDFLEFYFFCKQELEGEEDLTDISKNKSALYLIKNLRNACAHNNCIFENLRPKQSKPPTIVRKRVKERSKFSKDTINKKLTVRPILEFVTLILVYDELVSETIKEHRISELKLLFFERMRKNKEIFMKNSLLLSSYNFIEDIIIGTFREEQV